MGDGLQGQEQRQVDQGRDSCGDREVGEEKLVGLGHWRGWEVSNRKHETRHGIWEWIRGGGRDLGETLNLRNPWGVW